MNYDNYLDLRLNAKSRLRILRDRAKALNEKHPKAAYAWRDVRHTGFHNERESRALLGPSGDGKLHYTMGGCSFGRERYADEVCPRAIEHTGWYCDEDGYRKLRGLVVSLTHGRGFIAGTEGQEGRDDTPNSKTFYTSVIYQDEDTAAHAADSIAERVAGEELDYNHNWQQARALEDQIEENTQELREALALRNRPCFAYTRDKAIDLCSTIREARQRLKTDYAGVL